MRSVVTGLGLRRRPYRRSAYATQLLKDLQAIMRQHGGLKDLRFLLYPSELNPGDYEWADRHRGGVRWLEKDQVTAA